MLDTHWLVNSGYHVNANPWHSGTYTSNEFPHFIRELPFDYLGDQELGHAIALHATKLGVRTRSHDDVPSLGLEYGTLVPMRYMNEIAPLRVLSIAAWMYDAGFDESRLVGEAIREAIEASDRRVVLLASGSMSHRIWPNREVEDGMFAISRPFNQLVDEMMIGCGRQLDTPSSSPRSPTTRSTARAKATCTTPRCCSARSAGTRTRERPR